MKVLPDTSFLVAILRGDTVAVQAWERLAADGAEAYLSSLVSSELRYGFLWRGDRLEEAAFEALAIDMPDAVFDEHAAAHAAEVQVLMARQGRRLSDMDALIAGTAAARRFLLVTADRRLADVRHAGVPVHLVATE